MEVGKAESVTVGAGVGVGVGVGLGGGGAGGGVVPSVCRRGVPASQRALAGSPEPPQLLVCIGFDPVGVTHGQR